jgi:agmatine deiminase
MTSRRWPAEWEPQTAIWLSWPHNLETWPGRFDHVPDAFVAFARAISEIVPVNFLVPEQHIDDARRRLQDLPNINLFPCATNDCWIRDYGPTFVIGKEGLVAVDWRYNAWGGKYPPWDADAAAAKQVAAWVGATHSPSALGCEGGALETDGAGRLITTPDCLAVDSRNPGWTLDRIAGELSAQLGIHEILWLDGGGLEGDDTDGHIDQLARFLNPRVVVCAVCDDPSDPNHEALESNYRQLKIWGRETEPSVEVHRLPIPPARRIDGQRVPESYCNFLIVGGKRLILPTFAAEASDRVAVDLLTELCPELEIFPLNASDLAWGLGAYHCASQQQPAV